MIADTLNLSWHEQFFSGAALELWRRAIPHEVTEEEVVFLHEALEAPHGSRLLDVPCGNGRLSLPLSLMGYKVTAIDTCDEFLVEARTFASSYETEIEYIHGDMRQIGTEEKFDGAFCMGNSFGYFDHEGTAQFLSSVSNSLKSGARFILDTAMSAESFLVNGGEREWLRAGDMYMLIENHYDRRHSRVETTYIFVQNGKEERRKAIHWIYSSGELCRMFEAAGFSILQMFSSTESDVFALGDARLLLLAQKI